MAGNNLINESCYKGSSIILTTKHAKSIAIAPPFLEILGASIIENVVDTDKIGTFSGEIEREGNALECARKKCEWSLDKLGNKVEFGIASEGSFGPHPFIPFLPCDQEILYFIDRKRLFHLYVSHVSEKTNYSTEAIKSLEDLHKFANQALFPSHALIMRPNNRETRSPVFKGLNNWQELEDAFKECIRYSQDGIVWIETDMRANFNPSRMNVIGELATKISHRLKTKCPSCNNPGWGNIRYEKGLICGCCGSETELVKSEIFGCVKCTYEENRDRADGKKEAGPESCQYCNP
jgi:hypothetical protein